MKLLKKMMASALMLLMFSAFSLTTFATSPDTTPKTTPSEIVAELTGRTPASVMEEHRETGKTYGTIATEAGQFEAFQTQILVLQKERINARVASGNLTRAQGDAMIAAVASGQALCDGSGQVRVPHQGIAGTNAGTTGTGTYHNGGMMGQGTVHSGEMAPGTGHGGGMGSGKGHR